MRSIALATAVLIFSSFALAADPPRIDLDQPGVLDQLKQQHPLRYQAVTGVLHAATQAPCKADEIKLLKARFNIGDVECGMILFTRYPALRHVKFELDGTSYVATVMLENSETLQPATGSPSH